MLCTAANNEIHSRKLIMGWWQVVKKNMKIHFSNNWYGKGWQHYTGARMSYRHSLVHFSLALSEGGLQAGTQCQKTPEGPANSNQNSKVKTVHGDVCFSRLKVLMWILFVLQGIWRSCVQKDYWCPPCSRFLIFSLGFNDKNAQGEWTSRYLLKQ